MASDLIGFSATKLVQLIQSRAVSPVEVLQAYLNRIEQQNQRLNAIVTLAPDALEKARAAERALASKDKVLPLCGLPFTVKDTIETSGLRTTSGSMMRSQFVPETDAPAVALLKEAGGIVLAKTNTAEMAMDYTADNPVFGRTSNPYNPTLTPGGSSGGEAAAIACCLSPAGIGSDLAGSIRIPAHFCGIAGLKPSTERIPGEGQFPAAIGPYALGAAIGPLARRVEDLRLLFRVMSQREQRGAVGAHQRKLHKCRVVWYTDDQVADVTPETRIAVEQAVRALADSDFVTCEALPPGVERGHELWLKIFSRASVVHLRKVYAGHEQEGGSFVRWRLATADNDPIPSLDDYIDGWMERDRLRETLLDWLGEDTIIVAPVGATPAFPHDAHKVTVSDRPVSIFRAFSYSQTFNVFDLPSVTVPAGRSASGLPIGVQLVGRPFAEEFVLEAAMIVEQAIGGWSMPEAFAD